ncbi:MAG: hypothetical protein R2932_13835 [Caldilineaceae bacterium]
MIQRTLYLQLSVLLLVTAIGLFSSVMPVMATSMTLQQVVLTPEPAPLEQGPIGQTTVNLNLRSGPGTKFARLVVIPRAATVTLLGRNAAGDWLYVLLDPAPNGDMALARGWVYAPYLHSNVDTKTLPIVDANWVSLTSVPAASAPPSFRISTPVANPALSSTPSSTALTTPTPQPTMIGPIVISPTPHPTATSTPTPTVSPSPTATETGIAITVSPTVVQAHTPIHVLVTGAPLHVAMQAVLSRRDGSNALSMATATTDGKGLAAMDFVIPGEWADHTPIVDNTLLLTINITGQNLTQTVVLRYQVQ